MNEIEILITDINVDGGGIGRIDYKNTGTKEVCFIAGALNDEVVVCDKFWRQKKILHGQLAKIIKISPQRVTPKCPHFAVCGGCSLQHLNANAQIAHKEKHLIETISRIGKTTVENISPPITADTDEQGQWHYRRKARLSIKFVQKKERVLIGFHEKQGRKIADINTCPILVRPINNFIKPLADLITNIPSRESIAQLEIAVAQEYEGEQLINVPILIFRNLTTLSAEEIKLFEKFGAENKSVILLQPNDKILQQIYPPNKNNAVAPTYYFLPTWNLKLQFSPKDFMQVNAEVNNKLIARAIEYLDLQEGDKVVDLFCGLGNFTLPISKNIAKAGENIDVNVFGIEGEERLINTAKINAQINNINNCQFLIDNLFAPNENTINVLSQVNKIIIDPPRLGAQTICENLPPNIKRVVYVSCHPATLARDCEILTNHGFKIINVAIADMFTHTGHSETLAVFVRH